MESAFRGPVPTDLKIIETFGLHESGGIARLDRHLRRLSATCASFGVSVDLGACLDRLAALPRTAPLRVRLTVDLAGNIDITTGELTPNLPFWRVAIAGTRLAADNPWLGVKTTERQLYNDERAALPEDIDELIFLNERGEVCEGTITNVFADFGEGLLTPPLSSGLLPGILREELLDNGANEAVLSVADLKKAKALYAGNSLRGLTPARLV